jgi:hypothetical protein
LCNPAILTTEKVSCLYCETVVLKAPFETFHPSSGERDSWNQGREWVAPAYVVRGHSHTHETLSFLSPAKLAWEIDTSLADLWEQAEATTLQYSYPVGFAHCYASDVITALKFRGVTCRPTAIDGVNPSATDPIQLRRIMAI